MEILLPHFHLEYSANLKTLVDMAGLCVTLRLASERIKFFSLAGIRVRAMTVDHYAFADEAEKHRFIDLTIRFREGQISDVIQKAAKEIFDIVRTFMEPVSTHFSVAL